MKIAEEKKKDVLHRLARLEGQIRGVGKMVQEEVDCEKVMIQMSAAHAALEGVTKLMVAGFFQQCLQESQSRGDDPGEGLDRMIALLLKTRM